MKKSDFIFILWIIIGLLPFFIFTSVYECYQMLNTEFPLLSGFVKFGVLSTLGECIALRIRKGVYNEKGFGILPRAFVWGFLGVWIVMSMKVFGAGAPYLVDLILSNENKEVVSAMAGDFSGYKLLGAFAISLLMNTSFAPVFMTLHKITDTHIIANGGSMKGLFRPIPFGKILSELNWKVQWGFVFMVTIPCFWVPAHTITFLLPKDFQVLFAALLGIALGVIMAISANKK